MLDILQQAEQLVALLRAKALKCATAESCTGGGVGYALSSVPGASEVYLGGVVAYDNSVKERVLGVPAQVLARYGAVSAETAAAMAEGVRGLTGADFAVSVTGIAGPGGGSDTKPVGLVWFGIASAALTRTEKCIFTGDRRRVREQAIVHAMGMLGVMAL